MSVFWGFFPLYCPLTVKRGKDATAERGGMGSGKVSNSGHEAVSSTYFLMGKKKTD